MSPARHKLSVGFSTYWAKGQTLVSGLQHSGASPYSVPTCRPHHAVFGLPACRLSGVELGANYVSLRGRQQRALVDKRSQPMHDMLVKRYFCPRASSRADLSGSERSPGARPIKSIRMTSRCGGFQLDKPEPSFGERHDGIYARFCFPWLADAEYQPLNDCIDEVDPPTGRGGGSLCPSNYLLRRSRNLNATQFLKNSPAIIYSDLARTRPGLFDK
jgi:hypothetical protein